MVRLFCLVIRLPGGPDLSVYTRNLSRIREAYVKYLPNFIMYEEPWIRPLASGLWVKLPFCSNRRWRQTSSGIWNMRTAK